MARIPTKEELGNPQYAVTRGDVRFRPQDFSGEQAMGAAISKAGDALQGAVTKIGTKIQEDDNYEVQKRLIDFDLEHEKRLDDAKRTAAPEARDFTSSYRSGYDESARKFMETVPDHLKPKVDTILVQRGSAFEKRAYDFELKERDRYHTEDVNRKLTDLYNDSTAAPDRWSENAQRGVALIRSSRLPVNSKLRAEREFLEKNDEYAARARLEARAAAGEDLTEEIERLKRMPKGAWLDYQRKAAPAGTIDFIKQQEGDKDVGWDYRQYSGPYGVKRGKDEKLSLEEAEERLKGEVQSVQDQIKSKIKTPLNDQQMTALTSLFYNIGTGKGRLDQVAKLIDAGEMDKVPAWIRQYTRNADGGFMQGLADRRQREADLFAGQSTYELPADAPQGGAPAAPLLDPADEPVASEDAVYRHLSPGTRRKLLNVARTAQRGVMDQVVQGTIARVRNGEELEVDVKTGSTAFDRAVAHMTPHQRAEAQARMETAKLYASATRDIQDKSSVEAEEAILPIGVMEGIPDNQVAVRQRAFQDSIAVWKRLENLRLKDPAASVMGDPKLKLKPAKEIVEARDTIAKLDKADPNYSPKVWEAILEARTAAQRRVMPEKEPRLLTKTEAQNLLPLPTGTKFTDPAFKLVLQKAADTAEKRYGPAFARAALQDAIRWTITGDDEKRMSAGFLAKIAVGERITTQDLRRERLMREVDDFGVLGTGDGGRFFGRGMTVQPPPEQFGPPVEAMTKPKENPFRKFVPQPGAQ